MCDGHDHDHDHANITVSDNHPSENAEFIGKHRAAFASIDPPTMVSAFTVGASVWVLDHYYPGRVRHVGQYGNVVVEVPHWDYESGRPLVVDGKLAVSELFYHPEFYRHLRVDPASAEFWPAVEA